MSTILYFFLPEKLEFDNVFLTPHNHPFSEFRVTACVTKLENIFYSFSITNTQKKNYLLFFYPTNV